MIQRARRANPYPFTWEIPTALVLAVLLALVLGVQLGRSVANLLAGNGWAVVDRAGLFTTLPGILAGHAGAGLAGLARPAEPGPLYGSVILTELAVATGCAVGPAMGVAAVGPGPAAGHGHPRRGRGGPRPDPAAQTRPGHPPRPVRAGPGRRPMRRLRPTEVGWRVGRAAEPHGGQLWVPWDRTAGVIGPQGSGKTLDLLAPALIEAPGAAMTTLTKIEDLLLTFTARTAGQRPCVVLDPFGLVPGLPEAVWDPIRGCVDPLIAERRAKAFTAGTVKGGIAGGHARRRRPVLRGRGGQGPAGLLPRGRADRPQPRARPVLGRQTAGRLRARRDPA